MKTSAPSAASRSSGFTLIEMLVVISIIAILAGLLLPVLATMKTKAKIKIAKMEMANLATAISQYETEYSRMPASPAAEGAANPDFTFTTNNNDLIVILLNVNQGPNAGSARNPRQLVFFHAKQVNGNAPGISSDDWVFRDPWSNPYIITLDINGDNKTLDSFYRQQAVSRAGQGTGGFNGLVNNTDPNGTGDNFELNHPFMIWSFGPDGQANAAVPANQGVNKDNVLGWQ